MRRLLVVVVVAAGCSSSNNNSASSSATNGGATSGGTSSGGTTSGGTGGAMDMAIAANVDLSTFSPGGLGDEVSSDGGFVAARPYHFYVPSGYDAKKPTPLVIMLHGYSANAEEQELYWDLKATADKQTFLYAFPDGTVDASGNRFWNATDACCNFANLPLDDVAYVNAIIDDVQSKYKVDEKRIFVTGHSNGGFMSHRLACDAPRVAAIASLAGAEWNDVSKCVPASPVSVLEVHGNADTVIAYTGGAIAGKAFPSAHQTVADWAMLDGCTGGIASTGMTLDLDSVLAGAETTVEAYSGCPEGGAVELWTIQGGAHVPSLRTPFWGDSIYGFLSAHPKP